MSSLAAGAKMKEMRDKLGYTQKQIEQKSVEKWGQEGRITQSWLSKVEKGSLERTPDIERLLRLGEIYFLSPTQIYELFGLPTRGLPRETAANERMQRAVRVFNALPDGEIREQFLSLMDLAVFQAEAALAKKPKR